MFVPQLSRSRSQIFLTGIAWLALVGLVRSQDSLDALERLIEETPPPAKTEPIPADSDPLPDISEDTAPPLAPVIVPEEHVQGYLGVIVNEDGRGGAVYITDVREGSPAGLANLRVDDVIVSLNSRAVNRLEDMSAVLTRAAPGDKIELEVRRDGRSLFYEIPLAEPPGRLLDPPLEEDISPQITNLRPDRTQLKPLVLGIRVGPADSREYPLLGFSYNRGVVVEDVVAGSPADRYGLPRGAELVAVDGYRISHADQLATLVRSSDPRTPLEVAYRIGGRSYRQLIPLTDEAVAAMPGSQSKIVGPKVVPAPRASEDAVRRPLVEAPPLPGGAAGEPTFRAKPLATSDFRSRPDSTSKLAELKAELQALKERAERLEDQIEDLEDAD